MEEPKEPQGCKVRILGGARVVDEILEDIKISIYKYNSSISRHGYYLKPVHKVYRKLSNGITRIYEYYGRYWWRVERRRGKLRWIYVGSVKPKGLPDFHGHILEGLSLIREGDDVIVDCSVYDKFKNVFNGLPVERYY